MITQPLHDLLKNDFYSFLSKVFYTLNPEKKLLWNWHLEAIVEHLKAVERGEISRLIINLPPRNLKSTIITTAWPTWLIGRKTNIKIIAASYSNHLSCSHMSNARTIITSRWYQKCFTTLKITKNCKNLFSTKAQGFYMATSIGGTLTGEGGDYLIVDDPHKPTDGIKQRSKTISWFKNTLLSRLNDKNGAIIVVMHRLHQDDLSGSLLKEGNWSHLNLAAIAEKSEKISCNKWSYYRQKDELLNSNRMSIKDLMKIKKAMGEYSFAGQYQQNPFSNNNGIMKKSWLNYIDFNLLLSKINENYYIFQSWDCSIKINGNYTVCSTWLSDQRRLYLLHILRIKLEYNELKATIIFMAKKFRVSNILIEDKASGQQIIQELKGLAFDSEMFDSEMVNNKSKTPINYQENISFHLEDKISMPETIKITAIQPKYDKSTRLILATPYFANGKVIIITLQSWQKELENELLSFPYHQYDDQVDSITQMVNWFYNDKEKPSENRIEPKIQVI